MIVAASIVAGIVAALALIVWLVGRDSRSETFLEELERFRAACKEVELALGREFLPAVEALNDARSAEFWRSRNLLLRRIP